MRRPNDSFSDMTVITSDFISEEKMRDLKNQLNFKIAEEDSPLPVRNITYYQYEEVMREIENVNNELDKLKLGMASILEEKTRAENQFQASSSKIFSYASSMRTLRNKIGDVKKERAIKEFSRIEAMKEFEAIEAQREEEFNRFSANLENTKMKMNRTLKEIDRVKKMKVELSATNDDISVLQISLEMAKASEKCVPRGERKELESITEELISAKKELETLQEEVVKFMASMDIIRNELFRVCEETAKLKKEEKRSEIRVQDLNSKLLRANEKLRTVSVSEKKARAIISNLTLDLVQLKTEIEASKKEKELICEEIKKIEGLVIKTDSEIELGEGKLEVAIKELEYVKSSELRAMKDLKDLIEGTMRDRANKFKQNSSIKISKFEYEYLKERAIGADVVADKKVAAAQAWIEALKASEREILMKIEIENRGKEEIEGKQKENKTISKINSNQSENLTPVRRARHRKSVTLAGLSRSSITMRRKKNGSTPSGPLYDNQSIDTDR